jgi:hypothetical protein
MRSARQFVRSVDPIAESPARSLRFPRSRWAETASSYSSGWREHANRLQASTSRRRRPGIFRDTPSPGEGRRTCAASGRPFQPGHSFERQVSGESAACPCRSRARLIRTFSALTTSTGSSPVRSPRALFRIFHFRIFHVAFIRIQSYTAAPSGWFDRSFAAVVRLARLILSMDGGIGLPDQARHAPAGGSP